MDDSCAVCAEPLEWVAYGQCGHRDVCSTCVVRLRNLCADRRCCICKSPSTSVFITKALGDYTKTVDLSLFPADAGEGRVGSYWHHEATQAFFDDAEHYKMIKAMCTFSCSVCDKEGCQNHGGNRKACFRSLEQLKGHLFHKHRLLMCSLCLEGRRVFICEQKLYTRAELNQHISTGDSVVDGNESERGGFMGHPMCEFCKTPFYGENELYTHMSTEHYTCHMCQRQNPGHFEYYRNYDDLEVHFRQGHYLCEDEECLGKKFIVFQSEAELKRHNGLEHGGRMSRSKRNAVLQIPTSFSYRRTNESGDRRGRGRTFRRQSTPNNQLSLAIQASLETANAESRHTDRPALSSVAQQAPDNEGTILVDSLIPSFESLAAGASELASRNRQTMSHNYSHSSLAESSFPPLSATPGNSQQNPQQEKDGLPQNTMAARLRQRNSVKIVNVAQALPAANRGPAFPSVSSIQTRPAFPSVSLETANAESRHTDRPALSSVAQQALDNEGTVLVDSRIPSFESLAAGASELASRNRQTMSHNYSHSSLAESSFPPLSATPCNSQQNPQQEKDGLPQNTMAARLRQRNSVKIVNVAQAWPAAKGGPAFPSVSSIQTRRTSNNMPGSSQTHKATARGPVPSSYPSSMHAPPVINTGLSWGGSSSSRNPSSSVRVKHSTSASVSDFPPISGAQSHRSGSGNQALKVEDIHTANKSLVERIRAALDHNQDIYAAFKDISQEYREGSIGTLCYLEYVEQFGLLHLVPDIAKLCPDPLKQKELIEAYKSSFQSKGSQETLWGNINIPGKENRNSSKSASGKKLVEAGSSSSKGEAEVLGKDGYRAPKGKSKVSLDEALVQQVKSNPGPSTARVQNELPSNGGGDKPSGDGGSKRGKKKTSKFLRVRLGDGSAAALLNLINPDNDLSQESTSDIQHSSAQLPVGGAWRNGGGQKLFATSKR